METLWQDLRYGWRMLAKHPGFTAVAVLTLALGIGANTAIFSIVNSVLLRPLPYRDPHQLVMVWETNPQNGLGEHPVAPSKLRDWREQNQVFEELTPYQSFGLNLAGGGEPERVLVTKVSDTLFSLLSVQPILGRTFLPHEDSQRNEPVVLLGQRLWQRQFGSDANLIGRTLTLDGESYRVVGVMPAGFGFPSESEAWIPLDLGRWESRVAHGLSVLGRLKPGVTPKQAQTEMTALARRLEQQYPNTDRGWSVKVIPLHEQIVGGISSALLILAGAVGFVLLIACAQVANLLLARNAMRQNEIAIRAALGANRGRLIRQLLAEGLLLALPGAVLGLLIALWGTDLLAALSPTQIPRWGEIELDRELLGFTILVTLLTGIISGLPPALHASTPHLNESLKESHRTSTTASGNRLRRLLLISEIALTLVLLIGAGLLIQSFRRVLEVDLGFKPENMLTMRLNLPRSKYARSQSRVAFYEQLLERIRALPTVQSAGLVSQFPLSGDKQLFRFITEGRPPSSFADVPTTEYRAVSLHYLRAMGIPLKKGRDFTEQETSAAAEVALINESMARRFFPGEDPIGKRISIEWTKGRWLSIVGVVGNVKHFSLEDEAKPEMYVPYSYDAAPWMTLVIRASADPLSLTPAVLSQVRALDKDQPVYNLRTAEQFLSASTAQRRFSLVVLSIFAGIALLLAVVGIYGVMAHSVAQRTHEIGLRLALGAQPRDILKLVIGQGLVLTIIGLAVGLAGALALNRLLTSILFGVTATDPSTYIVVSLLLLLTALLASYLPARRAAKVDPMMALRCE